MQLYLLSLNPTWQVYHPIAPVVGNGAARQQPVWSTNISDKLFAQPGLAGKRNTYRHAYTVEAAYIHVTMMIHMSRDDCHAAVSQETERHEHMNENGGTNGGTE
jgi:hypothetical protein